MGQRQVTHPYPQDPRYGVPDGSGGWALRCLAAAEERLIGTIDDPHIDPLWHGVEAQDRISGPVGTGNACVVEADMLIKGPTRGLENAAFRLIDQAIRIDDLPRIDRTC